MRVNLDTLHRFQRKFLLHSFIYYELNDNIIPDYQYDSICETMNTLMKWQGSKESQYYKLCLPCGNTGSGFYIENYPEHIVSRALHILYQHKNPLENFEEFVGRWGYKLKN